jgi:hypothetical protein
LKNTCCYGSGEYSVDTSEYKQVFYLKFTLSSGACCGEGSYVTLSKKIVSSASKCVDSDKGKNYFSKGTVEIIGSDGFKLEYEDECLDEKVLSEQFCDDKLQLSSVEYSCADGCLNGECIKSQSKSDYPWQVGKTGVVRSEKLELLDGDLNISFSANSTHPGTGDVYLVSSDPVNFSNKKFEATTKLDKSKRNSIYDEHAAVVVLSPEKYLDVDLMDDEADISEIHFMNSIRCFSILNSVNDPYINYTCAKREDGKTVILFDEEIRQGVADTSARWSFNFKKGKAIYVALETNGITREYKIEDQNFISKFSNPHVYLGEYSSSGSEDGITISDIKLGGKKMGIYFRKGESENYNLEL